MFTVLNITKRKNGVFEKLFGCFIKDEYNVRTVGVYKGAPFYELNVLVGNKKIDAQKIIDCVGKCSRRLVTNDFDLLPQNDDFGLFKSINRNTFQILLCLHHMSFLVLAFQLRSLQITFHGHFYL